MKGTVVVDANLLVLLVVGSASRKLIASHKRLKDDFDDADFDLLGLELLRFSEILLLSNVLVEAYNLAKQIDGPALRRVQHAFRTLVETSTEIVIRAVDAVRRPEFAYLGLTDAALLRVCSMQFAESSPVLMTADQPLAHRARVLGHEALLYVKDVGFQ